jgi:hypothetical protein
VAIRSYGGTACALRRAQSIAALPRVLFRVSNNRKATQATLLDRACGGTIRRDGGPCGCEAKTNAQDDDVAQHTCFFRTFSGIGQEDLRLEMISLSARSRRSFLPLLQLRRRRANAKKGNNRLSGLGGLSGGCSPSGRSKRQSAKIANRQSIQLQRVCAGLGVSLNLRRADC